MVNTGVIKSNSSSSSISSLYSSHSTFSDSEDDNFNASNIRTTSRKGNNKLVKFSSKNDKTIFHKTYSNQAKSQYYLELLDKYADLDFLPNSALKKYQQSSINLDHLILLGIALGKNRIVKNCNHIEYTKKEALVQALSILHQVNVSKITC